MRKRAWELCSSHPEREGYAAVAERKGGCTLSPLPQACVVLPLEEAFRKHGPILQKGWAETFAAKDLDSLLNLALHTAGFWIYVPAACAVPEPLLVKTETLSRLQLHLGSGADLSVEVEPGEGHLHIEARLEKGAKLVIRGGGGCVRCLLDGEGAEAQFVGLARLGEGERSRTRIKMHHRAPRTRSKQVFRSILEKGARSTFLGEICIDAKAQQSEAMQQSKALLLSKGAVARSTPLLSIHADDVKASHGATVAQLSETELYYLRSRGVTLEEAKRLLVEAFCKEIG